LSGRYLNRPTRYPVNRIRKTGKTVRKTESNWVSPGYEKQVTRIEGKANNRKIKKTAQLPLPRQIVLANYSPYEGMF
jgi:hypothetical protein